MSISAVEVSVALASATLINTGVLIGYRWHRYARIWRDARSWRGLPGNRQPPGVPDAARAREPAADPRANRSHLRRVPFWATKRAVLKLYRATPAATLAGPAAALRPLDRPALVIWGTKDAYLPSNKPSASARHSRRPTSNCSTGMATG